MKKFLSFFIFALVAMTLTACGGSINTANDGVYDNLCESGLGKVTGGKLQCYVTANPSPSPSPSASASPSPSPSPSASASPSPSPSPSASASPSPSPSPSASDVGTVREPAYLPVITDKVMEQSTTHYKVQVFDTVKDLTIAVKEETNGNFAIKATLPKQYEYTTRIFRNSVETTYGSSNNNKGEFLFNFPRSEAVTGDKWDVRIYWKGDADSERKRQVRYIMEVKG